MPKKLGLPFAIDHCPRSGDVPEIVTPRVEDNGGRASAAGLHVKARATTAADSTERLTRDAFADGVETVIVHSGDDTVNKALQRPWWAARPRSPSGRAAPRMSWRRN